MRTVVPPASGARMQRSVGEGCIGIDLNALVGDRFRVGGVECFAQRLCEPCAHLDRLAAGAGKRGTLRALIHKGGLRADVLGDGEIRVGDTVAAR